MPYVTEDNFTPLIQAVTWLCLSFVIFGIIARAVTKAAVIRVVNLDDWFISIALLCSIGQIVAVTIQTLSGLGKPKATISNGEMKIIEKGEFARDFLYIASLCFAKLAVLALIRLITPSRPKQIIIWVFEAFLVAWAVSAVLVHAFECALPASWNYTTNGCLDRLAWWNYFEITNLITDTGLIVLPFAIVVPVQTSIQRKAAIVGFFAVRLVAIGGEVAKLVFWNRLHNTLDPNLSLWPVIVCTEAIQCSSIMAACALYLRPFLEMLQSGFLNLDDMRRKGMMTMFTVTSKHQTGTLAVSGSSGSQSQPQQGRFTRIGKKQDSSDSGDGIFMGCGNTKAQNKHEDLSTRRWNMDPDV